MDTESEKSVTVKNPLEKNPLEKTVRNKEQTKDRILQAVEEILANEGYQALGINRIAREAGVGKTLIYRYFGGLDGVLDAYGETERFWPTMDEIRGMSLEDFSALTFRERSNRVFINFRQALRKRPHTVAIYAWEMVEKPEFSKHLVAVRTQTSLMLVKEILGNSKRAANHYEHEVTALLAAGLLHLTIREHFDSPFAGLDLQDETVWRRFEEAFNYLLMGLECASKSVLKAEPG